MSNIYAELIQISPLLLLTIFVQSFQYSCNQAEAFNCYAVFAGWCIVEHSWYGSVSTELCGYLYPITAHFCRVILGFYSITGYVSWEAQATEFG